MVYFPERQRRYLGRQEDLHQAHPAHSRFPDRRAGVRALQDVTRFVKRQSARAAAEGDDPRARAVGFLMALYQRRLASSTYAIAASLENRARRLDEGLKNAQESPALAPPDLPDADELEEMEEGERERLEDMLEAITLAGNAEQVRAGDRRTAGSSPCRRRRSKTTGVRGQALAAQEPAAGAGLLRPPGPAAAPLHRVQGHARLSCRRSSPSGASASAHPRRHDAGCARRARARGFTPSSNSATGDPDPGGDRGGRRRHQPPVLQHPVQLRHPLEPEPPGAADGPHPSLRPDAKTA